MPQTILVVDDEQSWRHLIQQLLEAHGYRVESASDGEEALAVALTNPPSLVLLDRLMPGMDGVELCRLLRRHERTQDVPILMLTVRHDTASKVGALEAGADDYVTKPFRLRELIARLHAVLRRTRAFENAGPSILTAGELEIDIPKRRLTRRGEEIHLSPTEFDLLVFLMKNAGAPLTHTKLLRSVWGPEYGSELEYLRSYIRMLRKKIERNPASPEYILTEPWVGYRFRNPSDPDSPPVPAEDE